MDGRDWLTYDDFAGREGEQFDASVGDGPAHPMHLATTTQSTQQGGLGPDGQERLQFSLIFHGEHGLPQGTYRLSHADLGGLDLFLVPIGPDGAAMQYEAVFA